MENTTRGHSATFGLLLGILQWKLSEFRFGGLISASSKLSARKLNQITSLRSVSNNFTRHLQLCNVKKKKILLWFVHILYRNMYSLKSILHEWDASVLGRILYNIM